MSGSYGDANSADEAATSSGVQAGVASETARVAAYQAQSDRFISEHGAAVISGHNPVGT